MEQEQNEPNTTIQTIGERGMKLPGGVLEKAHRHVDFSVRDWTMSEERVLAKDKTELANASMGTYVSRVLARMITKLGPHKWESIDGDIVEREFVISQLYMPDVFYMYICLRMKAIDDTLVTRMKCPTCGKDINWESDLNTTKVVVPGDINKCRVEHNFKKPFNFRGKEVTKALLTPPKWCHVESMKGVDDVANAKLTTVENCIACFPELSPDDVMVASGEMDSVSKYDFESLVAKVDAHSWGPRMVVEDVTCPSKHVMNLPIDWRYDRFFSISSP